MEPLKLWLKNKHFAQSNFKEKRVVWNESSEEINQSIEASKEARQLEKAKLIELRDQFERGRMAGLIKESSAKNAIKEISKSIKQIETGLSTADLAKIQDRRVEAKNGLNEFAYENSAKSFEELLAVHERNNLGEEIASSTKKRKKKSDGKSKKQLAEDNERGPELDERKKAADKTQPETEAEIAEDAERNAVGEQGSPTPEQAKEEAKEEKKDKKEIPPHVPTDYKLNKNSGWYLPTDTAGADAPVYDQKGIVQGVTCSGADIPRPQEGYTIDQTTTGAWKVKAKNIPKTTANATPDKTEPRTTFYDPEDQPESPAPLAADPIQIGTKPNSTITPSPAAEPEDDVVLETALNQVIKDQNEKAETKAPETAPEAIPEKPTQKEQPEALKALKAAYEKLEAARTAHKVAVQALSDFEKDYKNLPEREYNLQRHNLQKAVDDTSYALEAAERNYDELLANEDHLNLKDTVEITDEKIKALLENRTEWRRNFENLTHYRTYTESLTALGADPHACADILFDALNLDPDKNLTLNNIIKSLIKHDGLKPELKEIFAHIGDHDTSKINVSLDTAYAEAFTAHVYGKLAENPNAKIPALEKFQNILTAFENETLGQFEFAKESPTQSPIFTTLTSRLEQSYKQAREGEIDYLGQEHRSVFADARTLRETEKDRYIEGRRIDGYASPEGVASEILSQPTRKIGGEIVTIYTLQNKEKVINPEGLKKYLTHLIKKGLISQEHLQKILDARINFEKATDGDFSDELKELTVSDIQSRMDAKKIGIPTAQEIHEIIHGETNNNTGNLKLDRFLYTKPIEVTQIIQNENGKNELADTDTAKLLINSTQELRDYRAELEKLGKKANSEKAKLETVLHSVQYTIQTISRLSEPTALEQFETIQINSEEELNEILTNLSDTQVNAINDGIVEEINTNKVLQTNEIESNLSPNPNTAEIQRAAIKVGYPADKVAEIENRLFALGLFAGFETEGGDLGLRELAAGVAIPLGNNFSLVVGFSKTNGVTVGGTFSANVYKNEDISVNMGLSAGIDFPTGNPSIGFGFGASEKLGESEVMSNNMELLTTAGLMFSAKGPSIGLMAGVGYDERGEINENRQKFLEEFKEVESAPTIETKAAILRTRPEFKEFESELDDDASLVSLYEKYKNESMKQAIDDAAPSIPITKIGAGIIISPTFSGPVIGIEFQIGRTIVVQPKLNQDLAKESSNIEISKQLKAIEASKNTYYKSNSPDIYQTRTGEIAIFTPEESSEKPQSSLAGLEGVRENFANQRIEFNTTPTEIDGKSFYEITPYDFDHSDLEIVSDPDSGVVLKEQNGKLYISFDKSIAVIRRRFRYTMAEAKGSASAITVIAFTDFDNTGNFNLNETLNKNATILSKQWALNPETQQSSHTVWRAENGQDLNAENPEKAGHEHQEKIAGMDRAEYESGLKTLAENRTHFAKISREDYENQEVRDTLQAYIGKLYEKIESDLKAGKPEIGNQEGVLKMINNEYKDLNDTEATLAYIEIQNLYYKDLWKSTDKAKILSDFDKNSKIALEKSYREPVEKAITRLGLRTDVDTILTEIGKASRTNFEAYLNNNAPNNLLRPNTLTNLPGDSTITIGTTVREGGKAIITKFHTPTSEKEGQIYFEAVGDLTTWEQNSDVSKVIREIARPTPDLANPETIINNPLIIQLINSEAALYELGAENFAIISRFFKQTLEQQKNTINNEEYRKALTEFIGFVKSLKTAQENQDNEFTLTNGAVLKIESGKTETGSYVICGNQLLLYGAEKFTITGTNENILSAAAGADNQVTTTPETDIETVNLGVGVGLMEVGGKSQETPKKPESRPQIDQKDTTAAPGQTVDPNPVNRPSQGAK